MQDALVYAFTEPATKIVSDSVKIDVAMNWYFIAASVILVLPVIYFTTTKVVIPRLGEYDASQANYDEEEETSSHITPTEKKALFWANMSFLFTDCCPNHLLYSRRKLVKKRENRQSY